MDLIDDYDERSVADVLATVDDRDFSADDLRTIRDYEAEHKDRSTLVPRLEKRIAAADAPTTDTESDDTTADTADEDTDATVAADTAEGSTADPSGDDADTEAADTDAEPSTISPSERDADTMWISPRTANIGEYSFRTLYTPQEVRRTHRVEQALEDGRAIEVDPPDDAAE